MINNDATTATEPTPTPPGMDYAFLRKTGIEHIQRLAGELWTDHNTHDPGITLLECLCYAITDVSYRLSFDMKDLLAVPPGHGSHPSNLSRAPLFTARDILTSHPVTLNDYRKLLIDIPGVRNAWIEKNAASLVPVYYEARSRRLRLNQTTETTEPLSLRGLYQVYIAKDDTISDGKKEQTLMETVKTRLHQYRQIAEDFADPILLPFEEITVKLHIVVADDVDLDRLAAHIYWQLSQAIAPTLSFHSLSARRQENRPIDTIFEGPPLDNGFIDETELEGFDRKTTLRSSDFIHLILDMNGVRSVKNITLESSQKRGFRQPWVLELDLNYTPKLKPFQQLLESDLQFERQGIVCKINTEVAKKHLENLKAPDAFDKKKQPLQDIPLPPGHYRHLSDYMSIQHDLPPNYGTGSLGLPDSVSPERKIQAKQLKAYLLFFDQLLANYLAQLANIRTLFCPPATGDTASRSVQTYFTQSVTDVPELDSVLNPDHHVRLQHVIESTDTKITRENKLLNHLMARFGEQFVDDSLLLYDKQQQRKSLICLGEKRESWQGFHLEDKLAFLQAYPQMSAARGGAFNYTQKSWGTDNVAGFKRRLCGLLGIQAVNTATINDEGFHLIEHLLLRPRSLPAATVTPYWQFLGSPIARFSQSTAHADRTVCHATDHGLQKGDHITISHTAHYNGSYLVKWAGQGLFHIETPFVTEDANQGQWAMNICENDPYSLQLSLVFPDWPARFQDNNFKTLLYDTLIREVPAHVVIYVHWFNQAAMQAFESVYQTWLTSMATDPDSDSDSDSAWQKSVQLLELLRMGKKI